MVPSLVFNWRPSAWLTKIRDRWQNRSEAEKKIPIYYAPIAYQMRYEKGSHTVGTIATNFALMSESSAPESRSVLTPETAKNTGSQNGIRHMTLSALSYNKFPDAAVSATLASHEENTVVDPDQRVFDTYAQADIAVDFLNNALGKTIADQSGFFDSNKEIFQKVLDEAHSNGVWQGVKVGKKFEIQRVKLTDKQYEKLSNALSKKDNNAEWQE